MAGQRFKANDVQAAITLAVEEVLETIYFAAVIDSAPGPTPPQSEARVLPLVTARLSFDGCPAGQFRVGVAPDLALLMAASFFGRDVEDVSAEQSREAICEMANMICSSMLSRLESEKTFHLRHAEIYDAASDPGMAGESVSRWFDVGDGLITASIGFGAS